MAFPATVVTCPTCLAPRGILCIDDDGRTTTRAHADRVAAASAWVAPQPMPECNRAECSARQIQGSAYCAEHAICRAVYQREDERITRTCILPRGHEGGHRHAATTATAARPTRAASLARMRARLVVADVIEAAIAHSDDWTYTKANGAPDRDLTDALRALAIELRDTTR